MLNLNSINQSYASQAWLQLQYLDSALKDCWSSPSTTRLFLWRWLPMTTPARQSRKCTVLVLVICLQSAHAKWSHCLTNQWHGLLINAVNCVISTAKSPNSIWSIWPCFRQTADKSPTSLPMCKIYLDRFWTIYRVHQ